MNYAYRSITRYRLLPTVLALLLLGGPRFAAPGLAQQATPSPSPSPAAARPAASDADVAAIRAQSQAFVAAFNKGDAKEVAAFWTEDGEYVDDTGRSYAGRAEIEKEYVRFFAETPRPTMRIMIDSVRLLSDHAAIEDGRAVLEPAPADAPGVSSYTAVHVKVNGKWLTASVRDAWTETPVAARSATDLEWLVGTWKAEDHGVRTASVVRWVVDGRFLERRYTTTQVDGAETSGVQIIGWNPQGDYVQSWDFSPDGGHAVGAWSPTENGWQAEVYGITGDGVPTAAVNVLKRLDDNAYAWQSVQRSVGDVAIPDTDEVIIKRSPKP